MPRTPAAAPPTGKPVGLAPPEEDEEVGPFNMPLTSVKALEAWLTTPLASVATLEASLTTPLASVATLEAWLTTPLASVATLDAPEIATENTEVTPSITSVVNEEYTPPTPTIVPVLLLY
jgi:hypothetical protein